MTKPHISAKLDNVAMRGLRILSQSLINHGLSIKKKRKQKQREKATVEEQTMLMSFIGCLRTLTQV